MKVLTVMFSFLLLFSSAAMANFSGSDDFNDNVMDPTKWTVYEGRLSETNGRLEFVSTGTEAEAGIWFWTLNYGSYVQDWTVRMNAHNSIFPLAPGEYGEVCLMVVNSVDFEDSFDIDLEVEGSIPYRVNSGWSTNNVDGIWTGMAVGNNTDVSLKIAFDSITKTLISAYDEGSGFKTLNSVNVSDWNIDVDHGFTYVIICESEGCVVTSGQVYADNFETAPLLGISNHLETVVLTHVHDFGDPSTIDDDKYKLNFDVDTDASITNLVMITPASEMLEYTSDGVNAGTQRWWYDATGSNPLTNRFGVGDYTITLIHTNGFQQSTIIPYPSLATITMQPTFSVPENGALNCSTTASSTNAWITLEWENIDPDANVVDLHRHHVGFDDYEDLGLFTDLFPADGPLSTRSVGPIAFSPGTWGIENYNDNLMIDYNTDGVLYIAGNGTRTEYMITVLESTGDEDSDGLLNWWESLYFDGPTNAIASLDSDDDGQNNLQESITGMCPTNPASCFTITNYTSSGDDFMIEWPSVSRRVYRALWSDNLTNGFQTLESDILHPRNSCTDTVHGAEASGFYQVEVEMQ